MTTRFKLGEWNAICDVCGFKFKASKMRKRWDGAMVCESDFELRNPLDFLRVPKEDISVPWARPEPTDTFVDGHLNTEAGDHIMTENNDHIDY